MNTKPYKLWFETLTVDVFDKKHAVYPSNEYISSRLRSAREAGSFKTWWEMVQSDFEVLERFGVRVIESQAEAIKWSLWDPDLADLNEVVLLVDLDAPRVAVIENIEQTLNKLKRQLPRKGHVPVATIPLFRKPNEAVIKRLLRVYKLRAEGKLLWEIAAIARLCKDKYGDALTGEKVEDHVIMQVTASREVRKAVALVTNAHLGIFPKY